MLALAAALVAPSTASGDDGEALELDTVAEALQRPKSDKLVVSIGDGFAADTTVNGGCRGSTKSIHGRAAAHVEKGNPDSDLAFVSFACMGATIENGLLGPHNGQPSQIARVNDLAQQRRIDALLVSVGANDIGLGPAIRFCVEVADCHRTPYGGLGTLAEAMRQALADLRRAYRRLDERLSKRIPRKRVLLVEYIDPVLRTDGDACSVTAREGTIARDEARWLSQRVLLPLDNLIFTNERRGWWVVDELVELLAGRGLCARSSQDSWLDMDYSTGDGYDELLTLDGRGSAAAGSITYAALQQMPGLRPTSAQSDNDDSLTNVAAGDGADGLPLGIALGVGAASLITALAVVAMRRRRSAPE